MTPPVWANPAYARFFVGAERLLREWRRETRYGYVPRNERIAARLIECAALTDEAPLATADRQDRKPPTNQLAPVE